MKSERFIFILMFLASCQPEFRVNLADVNPGNNTIPFSLSCPTGFIGVPGNVTHGTNDFCVMQFEAKNDGSNNAISQAGGSPYVRSADDGVAANDNDAFEKCANMSEVGFGGTFALIANSEWMTIARDIESEASNWSGLSIGSGHVPRGHSDNTPANTLPVTNVNDPFDGTTNSSLDAPGAGWEQKRTHMLSSNLEIWDFAGNIGEWVDWSTADAIYTTAPTGCVDIGGNTWAIHEFSEVLTGCSDGSDVDDIYPLGGYTSAQSFGKWYSGLGGAGTLRGGTFANATNAGPFGLSFGTATTMAMPVHGFRCVYRP